MVRFRNNLIFCLKILFSGHKSTSTTTTATSQQIENRILLDADSSSTKSGRRPSLDTVSTYLSQESRESQATASTADLINCSGSDDGLVDGIDNISSIIGKSTCFIMLLLSRHWQKSRHNNQRKLMLINVNRCQTFKKKVWFLIVTPSLSKWLLLCIFC